MFKSFLFNFKNWKKKLYFSFTSTVFLSVCLNTSNELLEGSLLNYLKVEVCVFFR